MQKILKSENVGCFRCLCLLGKEIGFMERALDLFTKQKYIFSVQSPVVSCI